MEKRVGGMIFKWSQRMNKKNGLISMEADECWWLEMK